MPLRAPGALGHHTIGLDMKSPRHTPCVEPRAKGRHGSTRATHRPQCDRSGRPQPLGVVRPFGGISLIATVPARTRLCRSRAVFGREPRPRQLVQPGRDLPLRRPTQGPHPQRLPRPRHARAAAARLRTPLRADRRPVEWKFTRAELERLGPPTRPTRHPSRVTDEYVGELPSQST
jgi:hypothetical protein